MFFHLLAQNVQGISDPTILNILYQALLEVVKFLSHYLLGGMIPAFFIAGAIGSFIPKEFILKYLGVDAKPYVSFPVAIIAGGILSVCSCGIIPLFVGIYTTGAGIGPAITFLFAGPAINLVAILFTQAKISTEMMIVRTLAAALGALVCGLIFQLLFKEPLNAEGVNMKLKTRESRAPWKTVAFMAVLFLVMLIGSNPGGLLALWQAIIGEIILIVFSWYLAKKWLNSAEIKGWLDKTWFLLRNITPKVVIGLFITKVIVLGFSLKTQIIWIMALGPLPSNFLASLIASFLYFGTIIGVFLVDTFRQFGMGDGPSLALFLAGPVVSLPSLLPIYSIIGFKKTATYWVMVVIISTLFGFTYGHFAPLFPGLQ